LPTTTATGGTPFSTCPPNQRGTTPCHDRNPAIAGQYHAPPTAREQGGDHKTSSFQWKDGRGKRVHQCSSPIH